MSENGIINTAEDFCPSNDFKEGNPQGKCWGCGHYLCRECLFYRQDFKRLGQAYIDFVHTTPLIEIITL